MAAAKTIEFEFQESPWARGPVSRFCGRDCMAAPHNDRKNPSVSQVLN
jgi:hypothetical protein